MSKIEHDDAVAHRGYQIYPVLDQYYPHPEAQLPDQGGQVLYFFVRQAAGRFVEKEHGGFSYEGAGEGDALLDPVRQRRRQQRRISTDTKPFQ